ncbi:MAG: right-handed parallel beta-helix repeat-containing protein [bacterium]|nr:right-handed parallel beta-helix repeat-containing protein [bacterium]
MNSLMKKFFALSISLAIILLLTGCSQKSERANHPVLEKLQGPRTQQVNFENYETVYYISDTEGSDEQGDGTAEKPWNSIYHALSQITNAGQENRYAVLVAASVYSQTPIEMKSYVDLYGGFERENWQRDVAKNSTVLTGGKERRVIIGADNSRLDGFVIREGVVRGKGAGILCDQTSPQITNCVFTKNKTLKPIPWNPKYWHEMAHDGGAIHCENGASPIIEHNLFVKNYTEIGRGAAISFYKNCGGRIAHNVFLNNVSGLEDTDRSSDGGAISVLDYCDPTIENNVLLSNKAINDNDGGAVFVALWSSPKIMGNVFVANESGDDAGALFVGGQEHRYDRPFDPLPAEEEFYVSIHKNIFLGNRNSSRNSGAMRFTMESRGEFVNNLVAHNTGIYFQRCEVKIINNTIFDDFLFVETKEGLKPSLIQNNIIWANFDLQLPVKVQYCVLKENHAVEGNIFEFPSIESNWLKIDAISTNYLRSAFLTEMLTGDFDFPENGLANRVFKAGDRWGVIHSNDENSILVWGDFSESISLKILPTYHLAKNSVCVDAGIGENSPEKDMDGDPRPEGSQVDIGADELIRN